MRYFINILFCLLIVGESVAQFVQIPTNTNATLTEISKLENSIVINGRTGFYGISFDNCNTVTPMIPPGNEDAINAYLNRLDENIAYIISNSGSGFHSQIFKTVDGGENWFAVLDTSEFMIYNLVMFDAMEGLAFSSFNKMYRTINGGENWIEESYPYVAITEVKKVNDSIVFIGTNEGQATSLNRGHTWNTNIFIQSTPRDFGFYNEDTLLAIVSGTGGKRFCKSTDLGENWDYYLLPNTIIPDAFIFKSISEGFIVGNNPYNDNKAAILRSDDFGETWVQYDTELETQFTDIEFLNDSVALISATNGMLFKYYYRDHHLGFKETSIDEFQFNIYPNPANTEISFSFDHKLTKSATIEICDLSGKVILKYAVDKPTHNYDVSALLKGMYLVLIKDKNKVIRTEKLIIEK